MTDIPLNKEGTRFITFDNKVVDVTIYILLKDGNKHCISFTAEEAWALKQILDDHLYLYEEVRIHGR